MTNIRDENEKTYIVKGHIEGRRVYRTVEDEGGWREED
jgi:hypothetical protein